MFGLVISYRANRLGCDLDPHPNKQQMQEPDLMDAKFFQNKCVQKQQVKIDEKWAKQIGSLNQSKISELNANSQDSEDQGKNRALLVVNFHALSKGLTLL